MEHVGILIRWLSSSMSLVLWNLVQVYFSTLHHAVYTPVMIFKHVVYNFFLQINRFSDHVEGCRVFSCVIGREAFERLRTTTSRPKPAGRAPMSCHESKTAHRWQFQNTKKKNFIQKLVSRSGTTNARGRNRTGIAVLVDANKNLGMWASSELNSTWNLKNLISN